MCAMPAASLDTLDRGGGGGGGGLSGTDEWHRAQLKTTPLQLGKYHN